MTVTLLDLWLPILLSAVAVFFASFLSWTVLPFHRNDWTKASNEAALMETIRSSSLPPGQYMFPHWETPEEMKSPEFRAKYEAGPSGVLAVWNGPASMGRNLSLTFLFYIFVGTAVGSLATIGLDRGAAGLDVFRTIGTAALLVYVAGFVPDAIWFRKKGSAVVAALVDGVAYTLATAAIFTWLWPAAPTG